MKKCSACQQVKSSDDFHKNKSARDGLAQDCRQCHNARVAEHYQKTKARKAETTAAWRLENADRIRAQNRAYRQANRARKAEYLRQWQAANPDKVRASALARWARKRDAITYAITAKDWYRLTHGPCAITGCTRTDIEVDHVIPLTRGGSHGVGNLQSLCKHHNRTKHNKLWVEFLAVLRSQPIAA